MAFFNVTPQAKYEALYPVLTQEADQTARQRETAASWYEGVGTSVVNGLKSGYYRDLFATAQATGKADLQQKALQAIQDNKPDPTTIGAVGQVLHGFGEQVALAAYSFSGGDITPNLMAMRTGVSYSASQQAIHEKEGMDPATAQSVARTEGAGVGLGLALPAAVPGKLLARAASGAGINAVTGMGQRAIISDTLRKAGYDDMAKQYEVLDGTALATDIALGAFFGGLLGPRGSKIDVPPSAVDAALVARQQMHMEVDSAPGIPTNTRSRNAHVAAMDASMDALARGERVDVEPIIRGSEFADKPIPEGVDLEAVIRAELDRVGARDVIDDLRRLETEAQARGIAVEADALPEVPESSAKSQRDALVSEISSQLDSIGKFTTEENKVSATIQATIAVNIADRLGITPKEAWDKFGTRISDGKVSGFDKILKQEAHVTETAAFKRWFGDSNVVDANGEPLVVYHGTKSVFDVFDSKKIKSINEGLGFYFTDNLNVADGYGTDGHTMSVYLSIKKPLAYDAKPFTKPVLKKIIKRIAELESAGNGEDIADGFLSNYGDVRYDGLERVVREAVENTANDQTAVDQLSGLWGGGVAPEYVLGGIKEVTGYDGIFADGFSNSGEGDNRIYIAWFPEQIKSATGNNGEFNPANPNILEQNLGGNTPRGGYAPDARSIALLKDADLSTFLHETGHWALDVYGKIASDADAPTQIKADMGKLLDWFGVESIEKWNKMSIDEQRPFHEKLAKGFEKYLMEGKAPTEELKSVFARLKDWFVNIYKDLASLDVQLSPEVRGVFDRMLGAEDSVRVDAKLQPPEVEKPSMTIPDETGKPVLAADAMASVDAEVKQAGELSKVMDVAVDCAMRFGQ